MLSQTEELFITLAGLESKKSDLVSKHGCVIVSNGKIIGRGYNSSRTQCKSGFLKNTCSCHAEIAAIRNVFKNQINNMSCKYINREKSWIL